MFQYSGEFEDSGYKLHFNCKVYQLKGDFNSNPIQIVLYIEDLDDGGAITIAFRMVEPVSYMARYFLDKKPLTEDLHTFVDGVKDFLLHERYEDKYQVSEEISTSASLVAKNLLNKIDRTFSKWLRTKYNVHSYKDLYNNMEKITEDFDNGEWLTSFVYSNDKNGYAI